MSSTADESDPHMKGNYKVFKALEDDIGECHYYLRDWERFPKYKQKALKEKIDNWTALRMWGYQKLP